MSMEEVGAREFHRSCRGIGGSMYARGDQTQHGKPHSEMLEVQDQLATRESQAGPFGVAERSVPYR